MNDDVPRSSRESIAAADTFRPTTHFVFLDYLRACAAWAVVYDHAVCQWPEGKGVHLRFVESLRAYVLYPFGFIQDFGFLAVSTFFLVSGFVITHVSQHERPVEFFIRRVFRIFPLLTMVVLVSIELNPQLSSHISVGDVLRNVTLLNYVHVPQVVTVGVAWTLIIEVLFYCLTLTTIWTRRPLLMLAVNLAAPVACIAYCRRFGAAFFLFSGAMSYVPYLVIGQIIYLSAYRKLISDTTAILVVGICYVEALYGITTIQVQFAAISNSYLLSFIYANIIFYVALKLGRAWTSNAAVRFLANSSYAVYLVHGVIGPPIMSALWARWGARPAIVVTLVCIAAASFGVHIAFERPMIKLGHAIARKCRSSVPPVARQTTIGEVS